MLMENMLQRPYLEAHVVCDVNLMLAALDARNSGSLVCVGVLVVASQLDCDMMVLTGL